MTILQQFSDAIRLGHDMASCSCPNYPLSRGLEVYRNNYRGNLQEALAGAYPVIQQLVGPAYFSQLAKQFISHYPSVSANLHDYGAQMAEFLQTFDTGLVYLAQMAKLEWAYHRAYFAHDIEPLALQTLGKIAPERYAEIHWLFAPGSTLFRSAYPVSQIWQAHQEEEFDMNWQQVPEHLLVYRPQLQVEIITLAEPQYHWLKQLYHGAAWGDACEQTLQLYPDFDVAAALQHWISRRVLCDCYLPA